MTRPVTAADRAANVAPVSLAQVQAFLTVAEVGTVTAAARRLHVSQPPLSRQLQALEDELGARLFERTARGMRLSSAGERFLEPARAIVAAVEAARRVVRAPEGGARPLDTRDRDAADRDTSPGR